MTVSEDDVRRIVEEIWTTMIGLRPVPGPVPEFSELAPPVYTGCVHITGPWEGAVLIDCPGSLATLAACAMLDVEPAQVTAADLHDVVGELANMVGGNIKGLLPPGCHLSLPTVTQGVDYLVSVPRTRTAVRAGFDCDGLRFRAAVHERL